MKRLTSHRLTSLHHCCWYYMNSCRYLHETTQDFPTHMRCNWNQMRWLNNFSTNHFKSPLFQDFFRPTQSRFGHTVRGDPSTAKRLWRSHFCRQFGWPPSKFVMRPPCDSEKSARSDLTSMRQTKFRCSPIRQIGRLADRLNASAAIKSPRLRRRCGLGACSITKSCPGTTLRTFLSLRIG
jgi:hypothetical protein